MNTIDKFNKLKQDIEKAGQTSNIRSIAVGTAVIEIINWIIETEEREILLEQGIVDLDHAEEGYF
jgi:hypothetical protein